MDIHGAARAALASLLTGGGGACPPHILPSLADKPDLAAAVRATRAVRAALVASDAAASASLLRYALELRSTPIAALPHGSFAEASAGAAAGWAGSGAAATQPLPPLPLPSMPRGLERWAIDVTTDVVGAAAESLRLHPPPAVAMHKPFDVGIRGQAGVVQEADLDRWVELFQGMLAHGGVDTYEGTGEVNFVRVAMQRLREERRRVAGVDDVTGVDARDVLRAMRAAGHAASAEGKAACARAIGVVSAAVGLQVRHGAYMNAFRKEKHSTYGRFFTGPAVMRAVVVAMRPWVLPDTDVYVDMSCGSNEFGAMLGTRRWFGVDIYPPATNAGRDHYRCLNWFDVSRGGGGQCDSVCVWMCGVHAGTRLGTQRRG